MPNGSEHCLTGILLATTTGFALEIDGGGSWQLDVRDDRGSKTTWASGRRKWTPRRLRPPRR